MNVRALERTMFWMVPAAVLLVAFAGLCVMTGTVWPWNHVVHEDGSRTLLTTVFYVEHAARELVPDSVLALAVAGAVRYYFPPFLVAGNAEATRWRSTLGLLVAATLLGILGGTVWTAGTQVLIDNLSQFHTREGAPLVWGAHWRYHLIGRFAEIMLAFSLTGIVWLMHGKPDAHRVRGRVRYYGAALLVFAVLTLVFRPTPEPFTDPAFLGHQLRELFTHALVTLPLALGTCLALARSFSVQSPESRVQGPESSAVLPVILTGVAALLSGVFLLVASLMTDAQSHGQAAGLAALLFPHFFEHTLGYVFVPGLAGWLFLMPVRK